jgi:hypothetical protein
MTDGLPVNVLQSQESTMQQTASQGKAKRAPLIAGLGAAFIASAVTLTMMMSGPAPVVAPAETANSTPQCQMVPLMLLASTTTGSGTVRFREGAYLSPPITLSAKPQTVVFPRFRDQSAVIEEVITIEGNATDLVWESPITHARTVYPNVSGVLAINSKWAPVKTC